MNAKALIRSYILENFLFTKDEGKLNNEASFLEEGIVDSTGVLELVMYIEEAFSINVEDDEIVPDNLDSVAQLTGYVQRKLEAVPAA